MNYNKLSDYKIKKIIKCFAADVTATQAALLTGINRNTINAYYNDLREKILKESLKETALDAGEFEVSELLPKGKSGCAAAISLAVRDESYFGAKRVRGKRGRGAAGKTPVFGLLKRGGKVFVKIVKNCSKDELLPIIQGKILENSVIHSDGLVAPCGRCSP
jgi:transposase-like protein